MAGVAAILSEYPKEIVDYVCDPRTGLPRKLKWLPTIAEIAEACDAQMDHAKTVAKLRRQVAQFRAIINDPEVSESSKEDAQRWLDRLMSLPSMNE